MPLEILSRSDSVKAFVERLRGEGLNPPVSEIMRCTDGGRDQKPLQCHASTHHAASGPTSHLSASGYNRFVFFVSLSHSIFNPI